MGLGRALTRAGAAAAVAGTAHAIVNTRRMRRPTPGARGQSSVSVLIPARDEAANIAGCLASLRDQDVVEILVLDDRSADATAAIAGASGDPRVRVLAGSEPSPGALGKPHACAQLAAAADPRATVLVFLDADVRLVPGAIGAAVALLESSRLDLISPHPRQLAGSLGERLVQPLLQWSILTLLPLRLAERSGRGSLSAANGQFLLVRRDVYERSGGHAANPSAVLDDLALLRAIKAAGGRGGIVDGSALASCRMYRNWAQLRDGYGKSLWAAFGSPVGALGVVAGLAVVYVLPPLAALRGSRAGLIGYAAAVGGRAVTARATGGRIGPDAFAHPVSITAFGYLTVRSLVMARRDGLSWKGRPVPAR